MNNILADREDREGESFRDLRLETEDLSGRLFEDCFFENCRFMDLDIRRTVFRDCLFKNCELSLLQCTGSSFAPCRFEDCRLQGINFADCASRRVYLDLKGCEVRHCFFAEGDMRKKEFRKSSFGDCEFHRIDLREADFSGAEFRETAFSGCDLRKADFSDARGYMIHPEQNKVRGAVFSVPDVLNLLAPLGIVIKD